jgi:uncharacterized protein (DUF1501 family)
MKPSDCHGCPEYLHLSRRQFLGVSGAGALAAMAPEWLPRVAYAQDACTDRDILVCIFLRGASDGLTMCVPHAEDLYYDARPTLNVPRPDSSDPYRATDLDGFFGFPPAMLPLLPAYQAGHLLIVHACGSPSGTRSHFDAMRFMEIGKPGDNTLFTGWLGRHLATSPPMSANPVLRAIGIGYNLQRSLQSGPLTLPIPDLDNFDLTGDPVSKAARMAAIGELYNLTTDPLRAAALTTQQTIDFLNTINFAGYQPAPGANYPQNTYSRSLMSTAALIKADVGVEAVAIDVPGWDTHALQGVLPGSEMWNLLELLSTGLAAFHADIFAPANGRNVTVLVMSEFGRRLLENGSIGTDHGHGNCMLIMGNHIAGGRVLTQWPGLEPQQLFQGRDLAVTIDFRDLLAEVVYHRLANPNLSTIFPAYTPTFRGVTTACRGDVNCDSAINVDDVGPFVSTLMSPEKATGCALNAADVNADGVVDGRDIQHFVRRVMQP